jgi:hypothetical protein
MADEIQAVAPEPLTGGPVVAEPGRYYRVARYLMTLLLFGYGAWSIYDGFFSWPNWPITHPQEQPKTHTDIILNQILGCGLPPMGLVVLIWALYNSRGEYRLEDHILHVPGHPPIPLDKIQSVNREVWDRKGIAYIEYDLTQAPVVAKGSGPVSYQGVTRGARGKFRLDDFVYDREATDKIFKAIEESLLKSHGDAPPTAPAPVPKVPPRPKMGSQA